MYDAEDLLETSGLLARLSDNECCLETDAVTMERVRAREKSELKIPE